MNEYKKEKDILKGIEIANRVVSKVCDWKDGAEVSIKRHEEYERERKKILDRIVPTRVCPSCRRRIFLESSWIVIDDLAICRSCRRPKVEEEEISGGFLGKPIIRFEFSGWRIKGLRERANVGAYAFAIRMGWSKKYQYEVERGVVHSLSLLTVEKMVKVFESFGVNITDGG